MVHYGPPHACSYNFAQVMPDVTPVRLETRRLLLRPFETHDVDDCLEYRNDAEFARFLAHVPQPFTLLDAEAFVRQNMTESFELSPTFAIVLEGKVIGTVNLEIDAGSGSAMLGYAIGRSYWGRGLAGEAALAVLSWGFGALRLTRVWASTSARNVRSQRVLAKLGMCPQPSTSEPVFAITSDEWFRQRE
jgi:[ribosomal protein S5]-alanine N-acetyltransferase